MAQMQTATAQTVDQTIPGKHGTAFTDAGAALCRDLSGGYYATQYQPEKWNALAEVNAKIERMWARKGQSNAA